MFINKQTMPNSTLSVCVCVGESYAKINFVRPFLLPLALLWFVWFGSVWYISLFLLSSAFDVEQLWQVIEIIWLDTKAQQPFYSLLYVTCASRAHTCNSRYSKVYIVHRSGRLLNLFEVLGKFQTKHSEREREHPHLIHKCFVFHNFIVDLLRFIHKWFNFCFWRFVLFSPVFFYQMRYFDFFLCISISSAHIRFC